MSNKSDLFWKLADDFLVRENITRGTMMGFPCLRVDGQFFASLHRETDDLIIKLPRDRVTELIEQGHALPFAPNGRTFKEWALIEQVDESRWQGYLTEALTFVEASGSS